MVDAQWQRFLTEIRNCRRCKELWSEEYTTSDSHPLTEGEQTARILLVSQDPSREAWRNGVMFEVLSLVKTDFPRN